MKYIMTKEQREYDRLMMRHNRDLDFPGITRLRSLVILMIICAMATSLYLLGAWLDYVLTGSITRF